MRARSPTRCQPLSPQTEHPTSFRVEEAASSFRAAVNAALLRKGTPLEEILQNDPGAQARMLLTNIQQHLANTIGPWGYGCVNGGQVPDDHIEVFPIPAGATEVILTSDGYPVVLPTLRESESALTELVRRDPAAIGELWSIGKSSTADSNAPDDRAYLRFIVE
jgi:glycerophosphoryl diester phosphodiesterase